MSFSAGSSGSASIASSTDVALSNPANNNLLAYNSSTAKWSNTAGSEYILQGAGIDLTGTTISTTAVQAFLNARKDGDTVKLASGAIYNLDSGITINKRLRITGSGELRFTAGIASMPAIEITVDHVELDSFWITNPNKLATTSGGTSNKTKNFAVYVSADHVRLSFLHVKNFQNGLACSPYGEYHHFRIIGNELIDMLGAGGGASGDNGDGEDRGDGIVCWGAVATIMGNLVSLLDGQDGRIGIHVEDQKIKEVTPYVHGDAHTTIVGNIVTGQYRRGISSEDVAYTTITGNTVTDSTWWSISLIQSAHNSVIANNTIKFTRTSADNQGYPSHSPVRTGIMIFDYVQGAIVTGNTIHAIAGASMPYGIAITQSNGISSDIEIAHNQISSEGDAITSAIYIPNDTTNVRIIGNKIRNCENGIFGYSVTNPTCQNNEIVGTTAASSFGIYFYGGTTSARADSNTISAFTTGIGLYAVTSWLTASSNVITSCTTGINTFGATAGIPMNAGMNTFVGVTTKTTNLSSAVITVGNN